MASSASPVPSVAPTTLASVKTSVDRRRAKADERLAAIVDTLEKVEDEVTAREFVGAIGSVWVRGSIALVRRRSSFD